MTKEAKSFQTFPSDFTAKVPTRISFSPTVRRVRRCPDGTPNLMTGAATIGQMALDQKTRREFLMRGQRCDPVTVFRTLHFLRILRKGPIS